MLLAKVPLTDALLVRREDGAFSVNTYLAKRDNKALSRSASLAIWVDRIPSAMEDNRTPLT